MIHKASASESSPLFLFYSAREVIYSAKARIEDYGLQVNDFLN